MITEGLKKKINYAWIAQWIVVIWFTIISILTAHNFNENSLNQKSREEQAAYLNADKGELVIAIAEHNLLREKNNILGRTDRCSTQ